MKEFFEFLCYVASAVAVLLFICFSIGHVVGKESCIEYGEKKSLNVDYKFYSGCWVESNNGSWDLKSTLEGDK